MTDEWSHQFQDSCQCWQPQGVDTNHYLLTVHQFALLLGYKHLLLFYLIDDPSIDYSKGGK